MSADEAPLRHPDGSTWHVLVDGLTATTVTLKDGKELRRAKTFPSRAALDAFVKGGREQMIRVGYLPAEGPLVDVLGALDHALAPLLVGVDTRAAEALWAAWTDRELQDTARWILKDGDDGALAVLAGWPRALDQLLRRVGASRSEWDLHLAGNIAVMCGSPLLVPLLRVAVLRSTAEAFLRGGDFEPPDVAALPLRELLISGGCTAGFGAIDALDAATTLPAGAEAQWEAIRGRLALPPVFRAPSAPWDRFLARMAAVEATLGPSTGGSDDPGLLSAGRTETADHPG